jgi:coenzyme F420-reducing hydrogenase alpha subunit
MSDQNGEKIIHVDYLARVEGEGSFTVHIKKGEVVDVRLAIFEPPRFFEAFLRGRRAEEAPDITSRICGICPVAYLMSATHAVERIYGVKIDPQIRELRRLLYCGEWIESHILHSFLLHAPDFLGYEDSLKMAKDHPDVVKLGLALKKVGNQIVNTLGGREIHPVNLRIGGFYRTPRRGELDELKENLKRSLEGAVQAVRWTSKLDFPDFEKDYTYVALRHPNEYPFNEGRLVSNRGLDIDANEHPEHFREEHMEYSTTLHSSLDGKSFFVGPMARYNLNFDRFPSFIQDLAKETVGQKCNNPFKSIIIRGIETVYAIHEALRIIEGYRPPESPFAEYQVRAGSACAITEAPRGILFHRYEVDEKGIITAANIIAPTSHNQRIIEEDLRHFVEKNISLPEKDLTWKCEQTIRNYDPCISCSTHFLKLKIETD